ncbi:TatD family hydrolase [Patescibacteria group bacterium]|nr:TatD family hydrolase [Patescibacteria group bacterium]
MKPKYIDIHGHVNFAAYDADREEVIKRAQEAGVAMITVGTQLDTSRAALELARAHEGMYAAVGLHPIHTGKSHHDVQELGEGGKEFTSRGEAADLDAYKPLAMDPKTVAIGECGLDYYRLDPGSASRQVAEFEKMIDLANDVDKPLMLHIRNGSGRSAYKDAFEIIRSRAKVRGNLHFFAGSIEEAQPYLDLGFTFSFTGVVTFTHDYDEIVGYLPVDRIMSETDCPFVSPAPFRGKRNEPRNVIETVKALAKLKGVSEGDMAENISRTSASMFRI